eukprot:144505-Hanusia_phi.AAC.1
MISKSTYVRSLPSLRVPARHPAVGIGRALFRGRGPAVPYRTGPGVTRPGSDGHRIADGVPDGTV